MRKLKQPVSIDGIEFDALIEQSEEYSADVPEYATEAGFAVNDSILLKPETLSMTLYVTDTPVTWKSRFKSGEGRVERVVKQLRSLYFSKKTVTVVTSSAAYTNMAITSFSLSKSSDTGFAREIPISFKKVNVTASKTVTIPASYGKSGKSNASAGSANTSSGKPKGGGSSSSGGGGSSSNNSSSGKGNKGSILYNAAQGIGLL